MAYRLWLLTTMCIIVGCRSNAKQAQEDVVVRHKVDTPLGNIPPLLPGEKPPSDPPNYFEPTELSSGAVLLELITCRQRMGRILPPLASDAGANPQAVRANLPTFCECLAFALLDNHRKAAGADVNPVATESQTMECAKSVQGTKAKPAFVDSGRISPHAVEETDAQCTRVTAGTEEFVSSYCTCYDDLALSARGKAGVTESDRKRCEVAARYWIATQQHLTPRQFPLCQRDVRHLPPRII